MKKAEETIDESDDLIKTFRFPCRNFRNKFESLAAGIMDERYSAIPGAARKKHTGGPRLIIPRTFESNRRLIISRFFPPPHCASFYQRGRTEAEHSSRCCSRNNRGIPLLIFTAEMDHPKLFQRIRLESFGYRLIHNVEPTSDYVTNLFARI